MHLDDETNVPLPQLVQDRAKSQGDRIFIEDVAGPRLTYGETHDMAIRWASSLHERDVQAGDAVAVMLPTSITAVGAWLGISWLRALEVPVNTEYRGAMLGHILQDSGCSVVVVAARFLERFADERLALTELDRLKCVVVPDSDGPFPALPCPIVGASDFFRAGDVPVALDGPSLEDTATIVYTSGTTGRSKGVLVTWAQLRATVGGTVPPGGVTPEDAYYSPFPQYHTSGKGPVYSMQIGAGRLVIREKFSTQSFWSDVNSFGCTLTLLLGSMAYFVYQQPETPESRTNSLRSVLMLPLIPELESFKRRFGVAVHTVFNMTETSVPIVSGYEIPNSRTCGKVRDGYEVRIVDENDREVPVGEVGELVVRASEPWVLMRGYWRQPEKTVDAWRNQWLHTGDAFRRDADGYYYFVDRLKDSIRRRGENISSLEVEAEVNEREDVLESAAIAVPADLGEDEVKVVVVPNPGCEIDPAELSRYLGERLPTFMNPRYIQVLAELPKTPTEKVRKTELRAAGVTVDTWDRERTRENRVR